ncbi:MAG: T9SS type A sorting domain-containing protein [Bacteroidetes bacterium]|nr:T9SS type A sorting domain-containing protein [Bacteroidota bacterium]
MKYATISRLTGKLLSGLLISALTGLTGYAQTTFTVGTTNDAGAESLREAIIASEASAGLDFIDLTGITDTIKLVTALPTITQDLVITGPGKNLLAISGENMVRPFFITGGTVEITDLSIVKGWAKGNNGSYDKGAGAGMGGAIYLNAGTLTVAHVAFTGNKASGGNTTVNTSGFEQGTGDGPFPGTAGATGSPGSYYYGPTAGGNGGFGAGGGAGGYDYFSFSTPGSGGYGGYGGGGGAAGAGSNTSYGPYYRATSAAFGGYGSIHKYQRAGGAGAGLGGALFIRSTATAFLNDCEFNSNTAVKGVTDNTDSGNGQGKAGAIFVHPGAEVYVSNLSYSGNAADDDTEVTGDDSDIYGVLISYTPGQPLVSISDATGIKYNRAVLNGTVDANTNATTYHFEFSLSADFSSPMFTSGKSGGSGNVSVAVSDTATGLAAATTYYFRLIASNANGADTSTVKSFVTSPIPTPIVSTTDADPVETTSATLNGLVDPNGFTTYYRFRYGTDSGLAAYTETDSVSAGSGDENVEVGTSVTGLDTETTYYFRIVSRNSFGETIGAIKSFRTKKLAVPDVMISGATNVQPSSAIVSGLVDSKGLETSYQFQYSADGDFSSPMQTAIQTIESGSVSGAGNAVLLDGGTGHLVIPDNGSMDVTTTFTIEAWVYRGDKTFSTILDKGNYQYLFQIQNGTLAFYSVTGTASTWKYSSGTIPAFTWTHVAVTFDADANEVKFYKNGEWMNTESGISAIVPDNGNVNIGRQEPASCQCNTFGGKLDEVRFWNRTLSPNEIVDNFQRTISGSESGLVGYWSMDETNAVYTFDKSGNNNHAYLAGGASFSTSEVVISKEITRVSATLTGLNPLQTYSYRLTATNGAGSEVSDTASFKFKATVPDLELWLVADSNLVVDGENWVVEWKSLTPNGAIAFQNNQTARPELIVNSLNGHNVVRFDGSSDVLWTSPISSDSGLTVIAVTKLSTNTGSYQRIVGNDRHYFFGYNGGNFNNVYGNGTSWTVVGDNSSTTVGAFIIRSTTHDGIKDKSYQNGIPATPRTSSRTGNTVPLTIGGGFEEGYFHQFLNGDIAELLVFNRTLSDAERVAIESRLALKYQVGLKATVSNPTVNSGEKGSYSLGETGATVTFTTPSGTSGSLTASTSNSPTIVGSLPLGITGLATEKYWSIVNTGLTGIEYSITLDLTGISGITNFNSIKVVKREDENATWVDVTGSPFFATVTFDDPFITISGLTSFSEFAVGSGSENPLPVELSAFSGQISGGNVVLNWSTTTETNNYGWEVEKQKVEDRSEKLEWETIGFVAGKGTTTEAQSYSYSSPATAGSLKFRLKQIDVDGKTTYSQIVSIEGKPTVLALNQNYPNPFNPSTTIGFALPASGKVSLVVYDILGREVTTLLNKEMVSGFHSVVFDASSNAAGVYFYKLSFNGKVVTKKLTLLK